MAAGGDDYEAMAKKGERRVTSERRENGTWDRETGRSGGVGLAVNNGVLAVARGVRRWNGTGRAIRADTKADFLTIIWIFNVL